MKEMGVLEGFTTAMKKYVDFSGRARRKEFWSFVLVCFLINVVLGIVDVVLGTGLLMSLFSLATLLPNIAATVRRLHDTDRSGWWALIALVPLVGIFILLIFNFMAGTVGENRFGPDPKAY